jgi:hypothetical protein
MVCNDQTFQFRISGDNNKTQAFNCVEGCYAVISVKSFLNKSALIDSLQNLASVSTIKKIKINPLVTNSQDLINQMPLRIIFAYGGDNMESDPNVGAMGLFQLISRIMTVSTVSPYMEIDLNEYGKKITETLLALHNKS